MPENHSRTTPGRRRYRRPEDRRPRQPKVEYELRADEAPEPHDPLAAIIEFIEILPDLSRGEQTFARGLIVSYFDRMRLSPKQWWWVDRLKKQVRGELPTNLVVLPLSRSRFVINSEAERMAALPEDERMNYRAEAQSRLEGRLVAAGVPRRVAREDVTRLLDEAEAQVQTTKE